MSHSRFAEYAVTSVFSLAQVNCVLSAAIIKNIDSLKISCYIGGEDADGTFTLPVINYDGDFSEQKIKEAKEYLGKIQCDSRPQNFHIFRVRDENFDQREELLDEWRIQLAIETEQKNNESKKNE